VLPLKRSSHGRCILCTNCAQRCSKCKEPYAKCRFQMKPKNGQRYMQCSYCLDSVTTKNKTKTHQCTATPGTPSSPATPRGKRPCDHTCVEKQECWLPRVKVEMWVTAQVGQPSANEQQPIASPTRVLASEKGALLA
jgi:hypothetical protein